MNAVSPGWIETQGTVYTGADAAQLAHMVQVAQSLADDAFHGAYRLIFNTGRDAGQSVFHVHAHVLTGETLDE